MRWILIPAMLCTYLCTNAANRTWTGAGAGGTGTDFNSVSNWSGSGALLSTDNLIVTLTANSNVTLTLSANLSVNKLTITGDISNVGSGGRTFTLSVGNRTLTVAGNTLIENDAAPSGVQTNRPYSMIISTGTSGTISLGGTLVVTNDDISYSDNNIIFSVAGTMTVSGKTTATSTNGATAAYAAFRVGNSPASITFNGKAIFDDGSSDLGNTIELGGISTGSTGKFVFKNDMVMGETMTVNSNFGSGNFVFDAAGAQTITDNSYMFYVKPANIIIGASNNPAVTLTGNNYLVPGLFVVNNFSISGSSSLALESGATLNNWAAVLGGAATGTFSLSGTATLNIADNSGGLTGSNFPNKFATISLDSTSTVAFTGANQTITSPGASVVFGNISLAGTGTKTLGDNISFYRALSVSSGVIMALGTKTCTLKSNVKTTAFIGAVSGTPFTYGSGGGFIIERYMPAKTAWRFVSTPVTTGSSPTVFSSWQESGSFVSTGYGTRITGPSGTGLDAVSSGYSLKAYDMASNAYIPVTNTGNNIANATGYMVYVRGDRSVAPGGTANVTNLRIKGQLKTGNQTFAVSAHKYQSVGNPYPARLDMRNVTKTSIVNAFIIWNPNTPGSYNAGGYDTYTYDGTNYKNTAGTIRNYIESGEAFFIQSTTGGSVTVTEASKTTGSSNVSFTGDDPGPEFHIDLYAPDPAGNYLTDGVQINFGDNYSNEVDNDDVRKIMNTADNIFISKPGDELVVERHAPVIAADTIHLGLTGTRIGTYQFKTSSSQLDGATEAILKDRFTNTETAISLSNETTISFNITADPQSSTADRFYLVFRPSGIVPLSFTGISANRITASAIEVKWNTGNEINIHHYDLERSSDGRNFNTIAGNILPVNNAGAGANYSSVDKNPLGNDNYYRIAAAGISGEIKYSAVVKVAGDKKENSIIVYPNPIENRTIQISFTGKPAGKYQLQLNDPAGKKIFSGSVMISTANETRAVQLPESLVSGIYYLGVGAEGEEVSRLKIVVMR